MLEVYGGGPWMIKRVHPLLLKKWSPGTALDPSSIVDFPVWIKLPHLDLQFWSPNMLGKIASHVGKPCFVDKLTANKERLAYARVLVELKSGDKILDQVVLKGPNKEEYVQKVVYESRPLQCYKCLRFGHSIRNCKFVPHTAWVATGAVLPDTVRDAVTNQRTESLNAVRLEGASGIRAGSTGGSSSSVPASGNNAGLSGGLNASGQTAGQESGSRGILNGASGSHGQGSGRRTGLSGGPVRDRGQGPGTVISSELNGIAQGNRFDALEMDTDVIDQPEENLIAYADDVINEAAWESVGQRSKAKGKGVHKSNGRLPAGGGQRLLRSNARKGLGPHG